MRLSCFLTVLLFLPALPGCSGAQPTDRHAPLLIEATIVLPDTKGRIDHLAIDLLGRRLFVAEIANDTVDEIDLRLGQVVGRIDGLHRPQGVAWLSVQRELVVAGGDGTVRFFDVRLRETARLALGDDADNVRIDLRNGYVIVGYGSGGLAVIDPASHTVVARLPLPGHPEGFQLFGGHVYVNVPDDGSVISADIDRQQVTARWPTGWRRLNFPMAIAPDGKSIAIAYRLPAALAVIETASGNTSRVQDGCGDADDVFWRGNRLLMVCGAGYVDLVGPRKASARVATSKGARTGLFVPELDRLFVAVPAGNRPAEIRVFKPDPAVPVAGDGGEQSHYGG